MSIIQSIKGTTAKAWDRIGLRLRPANTIEFANQRADDAIHNMQEALEKDGHTGFLTSPDGVIRIEPYVFRGYLISIYGIPTTEKILGITVKGQPKWTGIASEILPRLEGCGKTFETIEMPSEKQVGLICETWVDQTREYDKKKRYDLNLNGMKK